MAEAQAKKCFSSIQRRKLNLGNQIESFELCPSMDLVIFGNSLQQSLFRTVSWQKVANLNVPQTETKKKTNCCWSPNGRLIALAQDHRVSLSTIEMLANPPDGFAGSSGPTEAQYFLVMSNPVVSLKWMHVGSPHPSVWNISEEEAEADVSWRYQSNYVDQACDFLPPSQYHNNVCIENQYEHNEAATAKSLPVQCKTPLSVLCVCTTQNLELYLHGRYLLSRLPKPSCQTPPHLAASTDLTHLLVYSQSQLLLFHMPFMKTDRYPLQVIASLHSSIMSNLTTIQKSISELLTIWKSSFKPLDAKLQPLLGLLKNYGVEDRSLGEILKQYILLGHTSDSSSVANAMDQFFTSVQMNDQLLTRMERSLHGSLAHAESSARKGLLAPAQALCLQVQELSGLVRFYAKNGNPKTLSMFVTSTEQVWLSIETLLSKIVSGRFQVRDFCAWLRSAGSQIKAQGTAPQSVQRENARTRRVPHGVLAHLLKSLNTQSLLEKQSNISEQLLNIPVSDMLRPTASDNAKVERPQSLSSVAIGLKSAKNVADATREMAEAAESFFQNPLSNIPEYIVPKQLVLPQFGTETTLVTVHTRIGRDPGIDLSFDDDDCNNNDADAAAEATFFCPKIANLPNPRLPDRLDCRQWSVIAQARKYEIQLWCIPLGWTDPDDIEDHFGNADEIDEEIPFHLTTKLSLPTNGVIRRIGFYSDDGKSSLSSGDDSGDGKEGRQKLSIIFQRESLEFWLIPYDSLLWQAEPFDSVFKKDCKIDESCCRTVLPMRPLRGPDKDENDDEMVEDTAFSVFAQTRELIGLEINASTKLDLFLCGSRGVGGVAVTNEGGTTLELLDLEEDDDDDEDNDGVGDDDELE